MEILHKKLIDLKKDTFKTLSIMAAYAGESLKTFIEDKLDEIANTYLENQHKLNENNI